MAFQLQIIDTVEAGEIEAHVLRFLEEINAQIGGIIAPWMGKNWPNWKPRNRTVCTVANITEYPIQLLVNYHDWVGKFDFRGTPPLLQSGKSAIFFHNQDNTGLDAAAMVSRGKDHEGAEDVDYLLAWDNPTEGMKRVITDIAPRGKYDEPNWDQIRKKLSTSKADLTVGNDDLGCVSHVQITQLHPVKFNAILSHVV